MPTSWVIDIFLQIGEAHNVSWVELDMLVGIESLRGVSTCLLPGFGIAHLMLVL